MYLGCFSGFPGAWYLGGTWEVLLEPVGSVCSLVTPHTSQNPYPCDTVSAPSPFPQTCSWRLAPAWLGYISGTKLLWTIWGLVCTVESAACFPLETRVRASGCWSVASSVAFVNWLWMWFSLQRAIEGSNLGSSRFIHQCLNGYRSSGLTFLQTCDSVFVWIVCGI